GTGLGLAVVFAAVERSGGFLELTSSAGAGAQFRLYVPEALECPAAASVGPAGVIDGSERVLVVEDEGSLRDVACQTLRSHGYDVLQAADGAQAIGILAEQGADIDVLFTDVVMPDKGGREVVEAARAQWPHIRVIYTSGYTDEAISRRGVLHGEAPFLQKPYTPRELLTTIRSVMA
ncbi:MAG: response regulator, partial [Vicinamibacterales bacterium]